MPWCPNIPAIAIGPDRHFQGMTVKAKILGGCLSRPAGLGICLGPAIFFETYAKSP